MDTLIHGWDIARGTGQDLRLDPELVSPCLSIAEVLTRQFRAAGVFGDDLPVPDDADPQTRLLALVGRKPYVQGAHLMTTTVDQLSAITLAAIERFNTAFNAHDVDGVMAAMTDDCLFENTGPAPMGSATRAPSPCARCGSSSSRPIQTRPS